MKQIRLSKLPEERRRRAMFLAVKRRGDVLLVEDADFYRLQTIQKPLKGWKNWRPGDAIARMTKAVGIKPCGKCRQRQRKMNERYERFINRITRGN